jgi:excisionase family DNA binding protein
MDDPTKVYSVAEACKTVSVSKTTLYGVIKRGHLKTRKLGRRTLITAEALSDWLASLPSAESNTPEKGGDLD